VVEQIHGARLVAEMRIAGTGDLVAVEAVVVADKVVGRP
jgi:hypothetical protein